MATNEDIEELVIKPIGIVHNLLDLQARLEIKIVANVTSLKIKVDDTDSTLARRLVDLEPNGRFERERRVANATGTRDERYGDGFGTTWIIGKFCILASAVSRKEIKNLLRIGIKRDPIGIAT